MVRRIPAPPPVRLRMPDRHDKILQQSGPILARFPS
jgi:hypothetical protein